MQSPVLLKMRRPNIVHKQKNLIPFDIGAGILPDQTLKGVGVGWCSPLHPLSHQICLGAMSSLVYSICSSMILFFCRGDVHFIKYC